MEDDKSITTSDIDNQEQPKDEDIERLQFIEDAQRTFEHRRRTYADIFVQDSDSDKEDENNEEEKKDSNSTTNSDSDAPTTTDSDSPYGSDSESSSSFDEYHAQRKIPKKKVHKHAKGPVKSYLAERISNWPKYRYKKYKRSYIKRHGVQINYGNIHTKEIKHSLKKEKHERKKEDPYPVHVTHMMEDLARQTSFLLLDPEHANVPINLDKVSLSSMKSNESELTEKKSPSTLHKMKHKIKKTFKRKNKKSANLTVDDGDNEQITTNSDASSRTSACDEFQKSNPSLDKV